MSAKVLILVVSLSAVTFAGLFLASSVWQRKATLQQLKTSSHRASQLLEMAVEEPMRLGDNDGTVAQFRRVADRFDDVTAFLTDSGGVVTYATENSALRKDLRSAIGQDGQFASLLDESLAGHASGGVLIDYADRPSYVAMTPIANGRECHHCHGASKAFLGTLVTLQNVSPEMNVLAETRMRQAGISLAGLLILSALLLVFMRRNVINRIMVLAGAADTVRKGNLDVNFEVGSHDELTGLGDNLAAMVQDLKDQMEKVKEQSQLAEDEARRAHKAMEEADEAKSRARKLANYQRREVERLSGVLQRVAGGDLAASYLAGEASRDEEEARDGFLVIQEALNETIAHLGDMLTAVKENAEALAAASEELSTISSNLSEGASELSLQANSAAGATEQISANITAMAAATEEMSANVGNVSSTAEEMSSTMESVAASVEGVRRSIGSIAENAADGAGVAGQAMELAGQATSTMNDLGGAAREIGKVTAVIKRIAEQTNLLALNATIEAASAGDAGKGFAVVAHEIKELANQSAKAAEDIAAKIQGVQSSAGQAVEVIARVSDIIGTINEAVAVINEAVDEQTAATNEIAISITQTNVGTGEIARSISELAKGSGDISANAGEVAKAAGDVAENILGVSQSAAATEGGSRQVDDSAGELARVASELKSLVDRFTSSRDEV